MIGQTFTKTIAAAALALSTFTASPAFADNDARDRVIAGAVLLGIIALAVREQREERDRAAQAPVVRHPEPIQRQYSPTPLSRGPEVSRDYRDPAQLPVQCFQDLRTDEGPRRVFDAECLEFHYPFARFLPGACAGTVQMNGRFAAVYWPRCLSDAGYRLAGR